MKKPAFTLVEAMVSLLIISCVGMASMVFTSAYVKTTFDRDTHASTVISNINTAERLRAEVKTLPELYEFIQGRDIKVIAVGMGKLDIHSDGTYTITDSEGYMFSDILKSDTPKLYRVEIGTDVPNSKITTVVVLE